MTFYSSRLFDFLITRCARTKTILLSNFISFRIALSFSLGMKGLHLFPLSLQLCIFFVKALLLTLIASAAATAIDTTAKEDKKRARHGGYHDDQDVSSDSALTVIPICVRAVMGNYLGPARIMETQLRRGAPVACGISSAIAAGRVVFATIELIS